MNDTPNLRHTLCAVCYQSLQVFGNSDIGLVYFNPDSEGPELLNHFHRVGLRFAASRRKNYVFGTMIPHPRADGPANATRATRDEVGNILSKNCRLNHWAGCLT